MSPQNEYVFFCVYTLDIFFDTNTLGFFKKKEYLPPWKSRKNQDVMDMMLSDQVTTIARENMGVVTDEGKLYILFVCLFVLTQEKTGNSIIEKQYLDRWFEGMDRFVPRENQKADTVVIAIDPNGSAAKNASEMAIMSIAMRWDLNVVSLQPNRVPYKRTRSAPCAQTRRWWHGRLS